MSRSTRLNSWLRHPALLWLGGFLLVLLVVSLGWFRGQQFLYYWDQSLPLDPELFIRQFSHIWRPTADFGTQDSSGLNMLPLGIYYRALSTFTSLTTAQVLLISLQIWLAFFGFYQLARRYLLPAHALRTPAALLASLFYVANPYALLYVWRLNLNPVTLYALLPLILLYTVKYVVKDGRATSLVVLQLLLLGAVVSFSHPAYLMAFWLLIGSFLAAQAFARRQDRPVAKRIVQRSLWLLFVWVALNSWWLLPQFMGAGALASASGNDTQNYLAIFNTTTTHATTKRVATLLGEWHYYDYHFGLPDYPGFKLFTTRAYALLALSFLAVAIYGIIRERSRRRYYVLAIAALLWLFISGAHSPLWPVITNLSDKFVFLRAFRNPYEKVGQIYALLYSISVAWGIYFLLQRKQIWSRILLGIFLLALTPNLFFLTSGEVVPAGTDRLPPARVSIAEDYRRVADYLLTTQDNGGRILSLPLQKGPLQYSRTDSQSDFAGQDVLINLTQRPIYGTQTGLPRLDMILNRLEKEVVQGDLGSISAYQFEYVLVRHDLVSSLTYAPSYPTQPLIDLLRLNPDLEEVVTTPTASLFRHKKPVPLLAVTPLDQTIKTDTLDDAVLQLFANPLPYPVLTSSLPDEPLDLQEPQRRIFRSFNLGETVFGHRGVNYFRPAEIDRGRFAVSLQGSEGVDGAFMNDRPLPGSPVIFSENTNFEYRLTLDKLETLYELTTGQAPTPVTITDLKLPRTPLQSRTNLFVKSPDRLEWNQQAIGQTLGSYVSLPNRRDGWYVIDLNNQNCAGSAARLAAMESSEPYNHSTMAQNALSVVGIMPGDPYLPSTSWQPHRFFYRSSTNASRVYFYYLSDGGDQLACNSLHNLRISWLPEIGFWMSGPNTPDQEPIPLKSQTYRRSGLKATFVSSGKPELLLYHGGFNRNWQLKVDGRVIEPSRHVVVNGISNGWHLNESAGPHQVELLFLPDTQLPQLVYLSLSIWTVLLIWGAAVKIRDAR